MDFYQIKEREAGSGKKPTLEVFPDFKVVRSKDLMIRAKSFYAIWDEEKNLWSTDEFDVQRLVDAELRNYQVKTEGLFEVSRKYLGDFSTRSWLQFRNYIGNLTDNYHELDSHLTFRNTEVRKDDYVSRRLPYDLASGDISAWNELLDTLYSPENRAKIEWAIGSIVTGDSKTIQKFLVLYGSQGTGKSTILNIIQWMFEGYWTAFVAKELTSSNNSFALEAFKTNPLIAIDHDGDLSKIQDNSKLNALVAHEPMEINEKNKPKYMMRFIAMMFIGSNSPVKITDSRSGLIRRLIDIHPTGNTLPPRKYQTLMNQIKFELGAIAHHCREVYLSMGKDYYSGYVPVEMMLQTDVFFNFIEAHYDIFSSAEGITLNHAYDLYKKFVEETGVDYTIPRHKLRVELSNYFENFDDRLTLASGERVRSWFSGFKADKFKAPIRGSSPEQHMFSLVMEETESIFDKQFAKCLAQYAKEDGTPQKFWDNSVRVNSEGKEFTPKPGQVVDTKLKDIDTTREHYVKVPVNHIVIDFDLTDAEGKKSAERNLEAASSWPSTYAEFSKSGSGIHLHYDYEGDPTELSRLYDDGIEIKVFTGNSTLRRKLSRCNSISVAKLAAGTLPIREKKLMNSDVIENEKHLRSLIMKALRKEVHPGTKSNVDFIHKVLEDAYKSNVPYDVTDLRNKIFTFGMKSTNQSLACIKLIQSMQFKSEDVIEALPDLPTDEREVIFDVEVFPNLFVVCWKYTGSDQVVRMVNPSAQAIERLMSMKLVGFNVRRYDNHILYAAYMGYNNEQIYKTSQNIINKVPGAFFGEAYNISYADIYDFSSKKQGLKKWQIELGIPHVELGLPWDEPVPKELWDKVVEYCVNDVESTDTVFKHLEADYIARKILADLSGLPINHTTQQHTSKIVFGEDRAPQDKFVYTDLSEMFPGYKFERGKSEYRGEITGEGGYVYAEPGIYRDVALLDVASMHPTSIRELNLFGDYTHHYTDLVKARVAIKRGEIDEAKKMLGGKLARHLNNPDQIEALAYALKIVANIVYGFTSASFPNAFRDPRNIDNIVAKRGALFMVDLKHFVQDYVGRNGERFTVAHIKTDSIKIPNATQEIIGAVMEFGQKYGYEFEHEETYEKFCLVNDAVYIAKTKQGKKPPHWVATGAQFQHPYVFKTLFSKEKITFRDKCEERHVTTSMYLDFNDTGEDIPMAFINVDKNNRQFIGKAGLFCPIKPGCGGGQLMREKDGKFSAVTGTKNYFWLEADVVKTMNKEKDIDLSYFQKLVDDAVETIGKYGDFEAFVD